MLVTTHGFYSEWVTRQREKQWWILGAKKNRKWGEKEHVQSQQEAEGTEQVYKLLQYHIRQDNVVDLVWNVSVVYAYIPRRQAASKAST